LVFFELSEFSGLWTTFVWAMEFTGNSPVTFVLRSGQSADIIAAETFNPIDSRLFVPFKLAFASATELSVTRLAKPLSEFVISDLSDRLNQVLPQLDIKVAHIPHFLHFDDQSAIIETPQAVVVLLEHEFPGPLDLSFAAIRRTGSIDTTVFYNQVEGVRKSIQLAPVRLDGYDKSGVIDFPKIPANNRIRYVAVLLSHGKPDAPLSDFGRVSLKVRYESERRLLLHLPVVLGKEPGFFVGAFEIVNEAKWKFVYCGLGCSSHLPPSIAKTALKHLMPVEEEVVWRD
jgi:hypothetical protein